MKLAILLLLCPAIVFAGTTHWRLVEQIEHGRTKTFQAPLNQIYYTSLEACRADGSSAKYKIKPTADTTLFDSDPYTHIITCIEYKQGQDSPVRTP